MLELRNPHSILAALKVRPKAVKSVSIQTIGAGDVWDHVAHVARSNGVSVLVGSPPDSRRSEIRGSRDGRKKSHGRQGSRNGKEGRPSRDDRGTERTSAGMAIVEPPSPIPLEQLLNVSSPPISVPPRHSEDQKADRAPEFGIWLALDQVQDPQNTGAIFRLAGFFGARGIIMTKDRSAPVNATVCDVATGGVEYVPFSTVANLSQAIEKAQQNSIWILGTCERATESLYNVKRDRHWMIIVGNEGSGMRRLTRERCDQLVALPPSGPVPSLNVAAATSACLAVLSHAPSV
ncbi:MAG: RNA methyltransferase [Planctomycetaceae bacterium]